MSTTLPGRARPQPPLGALSATASLVTIAGIEVTLGAAPGGRALHSAVYIDLLDAQNKPLGTAYAGDRVASCCGVPLDLSPGTLDSFADFSSLNFSVTAGQQLKFRLHATTPVVAGTSGDAYAGGTLLVAGVPDPSRDLAFKIVLQ